MVEAIILAQQGEPEVMAQLQEKWASAAAQMDAILEGTVDIVQSLQKRTRRGFDRSSTRPPTAFYPTLKG